MKISLLTPSRNMLSWLTCCAASVADQGVAAEHIVIDALSTDGTREWLQANPQIRSVSERDEGIFAALNKGLRLSQGEIIGQLNCDEQYLPGTLAAAVRFFEQHPETDILFGDFLVLRPDGSLLAYRKAFRPRWIYILTGHLYTFTCTMFFRRRLLEAGLLFDPHYRIAGDADFVRRVLRRGFRVAHVRQYFSTYMVTGSNASLGRQSLRRVQAELREMTPFWLRCCRLPLQGARLIEKMLHGNYRQSFPLEYSIYTPADLARRQVLKVASGTFRWHTSS